MRTLFSLILLYALLGITSAMAADAPTRPAAVAGTGVRTVYLVRHGFYEPDSSADPRFGPGLNPLGREQAAIVGRYLAALPVKFSSMTSSMLTRARETADLMTRSMHMRVERDSLLNECTPRSGNPAQNRGATEAEIAASETQLQAAWTKYMRASPEADTHDVLVAHGNVIRWFVAKAVAGETQMWGNMDIAHASVSVLTVRPDGKVRLVMFSDLNDLPLDKQTWAGRGPGWAKPGLGMK